MKMKTSLKAYNNFLTDSQRDIKTIILFIINVIDLLTIFLEFIVAKDQLIIF